MEELYHYGIKGQKWYRRRYQNKDGSLTPAGKKRYAAGRFDTSSMSEDELRSKINRLNLEKEYLELNAKVSTLNPPEVSRGKKFIDSVGKDVIAPAAKEAGKKLLTDLLKVQGSKILGLDQVKTEYDKLKEEVDILDLKNKKEAYTSKKTKTEYDKLKEEVDILKLKRQKAQYESEINNYQKKKDKKESTGNKNKDPIDVDFRDIDENDVAYGRDFVDEYLRRMKNRGLPG